MVDSYLGEIRLFSGKSIPANWALCDGRLLNITSNEALYSLIGITYGGDGRTTFGLPDLRGRVPISQGQGPGLTARTLGANGGEEQVGLSEANTPAHTHILQTAGTDATTPTFGPNVVFANATPPTVLYINDGATPVPIVQNPNPDTISTGGGQGRPHANVMPTMALNYIIALIGMYPAKP